MRLLLVADVHDAVRNVKAIRGSYDAVIASGDFTYRRRLDAALEVLEALAAIAPVYFVPGNTDPPQLAAYENERIKPLHGKTAALGPYVVGGAGGSLPTPFDDLFRVTEEELERLLSSLSPTPHILVVHNPPRGHLDRVGGVKPVGSLAVKRYIEERQPVLSVHGHIHEDRGIDIVGDTVVVNPGPLKEGYYAEAELNGAKVVATLKKL
ncbi:metallophosphoesterase family protein [Pyrobaculum arsenaticum]|uniref:Metallophosphoesterase n=2 Tax=Pyrobaculum arsenaticum TaxID=121277 RepID=A4WHL6_PYRAR|nr:metallophosphoesterase family protein [Pyrobaculum arsenaticum]ABP49883.1 metallophosphoesterase [Pyrobaculum arsenaticum DSM 13514]NYR15870.1 metallophosphoesterase [Pyrobaculum arsenaticum]